MIYESIFGWFNYQKVFDIAIEQAEVQGGKSIFVEVGAWLGKSSSYMAERLKIQNIFHKTLEIEIEYWVYDTWQGGGDQHNDITKWFPDNPADNIFHVFYHNLFEVKDFYRARILDTFEACKRHEDNSLDFVFLDDLHQLEHMRKELRAWWAKVKVGGIFAGHDYDSNWVEVVQAVDEFAAEYGLIIESINGSWMVRK
jgi:hypothetical protein